MNADTANALSVTLEEPRHEIGGAIDGEVQDRRRVQQLADVVPAPDLVEIALIGIGPFEFERVAAQVGGELGRTALGCDPPLIDDDHPIRVSLSLRRVIRADDDRRALPRALAQRVPDRRARLRIERECRLVEQQELRLMQQSAGEVEPSPESAGQRLATIAGAIVKPKRTEQLAAASPQLAAAQSEEASVELQRLVERHQVVGARLLEHQPDPAADVSAVRCAEDPCGAGLRTDLAAEQLEHRRLARPVRAEQRDGLALLDPEGDRFDAATAGPVEAGVAQFGGQARG